MSRGKFWKVSKRLFANPAFRQLSHVQKLVAVYCLTEQTNRVGIFLLSVAKGSEDLNLSRRAFESAFLTVCRAFEWKWDAKARVLWLPGWWRHNSPDNKDALSSFLKDLLEVPATPLLEEFFSNTDDLAEQLRQVFQDTVVTLALRPSMTPCPPECPTPSDHGVDQGGGHTRLRRDLNETRKDRDVQEARTQLPFSPEELAEKFNAVPGVKHVILSNQRLPTTIRQQAIARLKSYPEQQFWTDFISLIAASSFLTGKTPGQEGREPFRATFDWVLGPKNFDKILSGKYTDSPKTKPPTGGGYRFT